MNGCLHGTLTHMSQKMVIEAKLTEMEKIHKDEGVSRCHKGIHGKGERGEDDQHQVGSLQTKGQKNIQLPRHVLWHASSTLETNVVRCLQEHQV